MAVYVAAALTMRKKFIISGLKKSGATSPETAKTLAEAGVIKPDNYPGYTESLVQMGIIQKTKDGKYWLKQR